MKYTMQINKILYLYVYNFFFFEEDTSRVCVKDEWASIHDYLKSDEMLILRDEFIHIASIRIIDCDG